MKKLMILMLVLGMATAVNAAMVWSVIGNSGAGSDVLPGDIITLSLDIGAGDTSTGVTIGAIIDNGAGGLATGSAVNPYFSTGIQNGMDKPTWEGFAGPSGYTLGDRIWLQGANATPSALGANILTISYTVNPAAINGSVITFSGVGEPMVGLGADVSVNTVATPVPSVGLNVVPEPMTVALLGLGGLFIRRKK